MASLAHQLILDMMAPRVWFLLTLPLLILLVHYSLATWFGVRGARNNQQKQQRQQLENDDDHRLPPSPPALPLLGHLHLVGSLPHVSLRRLAAKHGPDLMLLRLGAMPVLVASSPRAAEAVLRTHDHVFASRPHSVVAEVVLYGPSDVGFAPYGDYWRQAKKLLTTHLLSVRKVQSFRLAREEEVRAVMARLREAAAGGAGAAVDVGGLLGSFTNDMACRAVMGESFRSEGRNKLFRELVADTSPLLGGFNVEEFFPFLARFGVLSKVVRAKSERLRRRWDELLDKLIEDHKGEYDGDGETSATGPKDDDDFIHVLLSVRHEYGLTKQQMKAILLDVFFGGIDTSASVLDYTIVELIQRPHLMKKLQAELRAKIPRGQDVVTEADLADMAYLRAVIKESLRLRTVTPLLAPRVSMARCTIDGYVIPSGVRLLINSWAIARDPSFWEDPEEFVPERFLDGGGAAHLSFRGNDFQFLPFGSGRRMCPGMNLGIATVEVILANLLCHFDWELPPGQDGRGIDMSEEFGLVVHRKKKLLLVPKLRVV
ncbi:hypothetical protein ACP4OV_004452 [Aristida adscensionis]